MSRVLTDKACQKVVRSVMSYTAEFRRVLPQFRIKPAGITIPGIADDLETAYRDEEDSLFLSWMQWTGGWHARDRGRYHNWSDELALDWPPPGDHVVSDIERNLLPQNNNKRRKAVVKHHRLKG